MLVEALEMLCAEAADALAPHARDQKPDDLLSPLHLMCLQEIKCILNPVLSFCHFLYAIQIHNRTVSWWVEWVGEI